MSHLLGDTTDTYAQAATLAAGSQQGWQFEAAESGTITELYFLTAAGLANTGVTSVKVAVYADTGGAPSTLLGSGVISAGTPGMNSWLELTSGVSINVVGGEKYWLAILPVGAGSLHFNTSVASGGSASVKTPSASGSFQSPWPAFNGGTDTAYTNGPLGFSGEGTFAPSLPELPRMRMALTTHHDPDTSTFAQVKRWLTAAVDAEMSILQNDAREARVTLNLYDEALSLLDSGRNDYLYRLYVAYEDQDAIWAPVRSEWDADAGTCTLIAVDADRLQAHYLRDGDPAIDNAPITADYQGMRLLRDAANNTADQDTRGVVPLGIANGTDDLGERAAATVRFARWDQVWASMIQLAQGAMDFELFPLNPATVETYDYMDLNTYAQQGADRTQGEGAVAFHCGYGLNNLSGHRALPDRFYTHVHAHSDGGHDRVTAYHEDSSRYRGVYVRETATQYQDPDKTELTAAAKSYIRAFGVPAHAFEVTLRPEALQQFVALAGYGIGDRVRVGVKKGYYNREDDVKIVAIKLRQTGREPPVADLTVVAEVVVDADIGTTEDS